MLNALDFDLTQLDLSELVLLALTLFNDHPQILLADLTIGILLVNSVLVLNLAEVTINFINLTLLIILDLDQVLIYDVDRIGCHLFLLCFVRSRKLIDNLLVPILEFACVFNLGVQICNHFLLHVIRHSKIGLIID